MKTEVLAFLKANGRKGGRARSRALSPERRREIARSGGLAKQAKRAKRNGRLARQKGV